MNKLIEVGKFYFVHDGSKTGHPALVVWKDDKRNLYLAIKIGTSQNKNNLPLEKSLSPNAKHFIYKRPFLGKRKDFGFKALLDLTVTWEIETISKNTQKLKPVESKSIKRKDRRNFAHSFTKK